jgi:hypothetical protein
LEDIDDKLEAMEKMTPEEADDALPAMDGGWGMGDGWIFWGHFKVKKIFK